jgi:hypothetical protein
MPRKAVMPPQSGAAPCFGLVAKPVLETCRAEARVIAWGEALVASSYPAGAAGRG